MCPPLIKDATYEIVENYGYDIGYYDGIRNTLDIIHKALQIPTTQEERVSILLEMVGKEIDEAIRIQKNSEKILIAQY
jgi:hypothetical protein